MPNVASLINKSNIKKFRNYQRTELPNRNCTYETNHPIKKKCQFECIVYTVEVHSRGSNDINVSRNIKKGYVLSTLGPFKKYITIIEVVLRMKYIGIELVYLTIRGRLRI